MAPSTPGAARRGASGVTGGLLALTRTLGQVVGTVVLGSVWSARAVARAGAPTGRDATLLPGGAQVAGLHDVVGIVQIMIVVGLALVVSDLLRRRRDGSRRQSRPPAVASPGRVR